MKPDFGATAKDYSRYRAGFPESFFERLTRFGLGRTSQSIVDLGTGTGTLARGFARRGCNVIAIDIAEPLLEQARQLDEVDRVSVDYRVASAEDTKLPSASADMIIAGQCWHWFDRPRAAAEVARVLREDGALVIAHLDWIPLEGNVVSATEKLIEEHNPKWTFGGGVGIYGEWLRDVGNAGFRALETFSYDVCIPYSHEAWRGRIRASAGVGANLSEERVREFDEALAALLALSFPHDPLAVPHRVFGLVARSPAAEASLASLGERKH